LSSSQHLQGDPPVAMCKGLSDAEVRTRAAGFAAAEFSAAAAKVGNEELREAASQLALQGLTALEGHGVRCAQFLLGTLQSAVSLGASAKHDAVWMLQRMALKSESAKAWIMQAGGAEVIHKALLVGYADEKFGQEGAWLAYYLDGLRGLADLLCRSRTGGSSDHLAVRVAVAWVVFELVTEERKELGPQPKAESASVLAVLLEAMGHESTSHQAQWACVAALDAMVKCEPRLGSLFLEGGGAKLIVRALRSAIGMGYEGEEFRRAVSFLVTSLSDGSAPAANALVNEGAAEALREVCRQGTGRDIDAAMWALGSVGGLGCVLEAMTEQSSNSPWVFRGGIIALSSCAWSANSEGEDLQRLPQALLLVLECLTQEDAAAPSDGTGSRWLTECITALGSVLVSIAPHVPPGSRADVDRGMEALLKRLQDTPVLRSTPTRPGPGTSAAAAPEEHVEANVTAEKASEAIGRIASAAPEWRHALRSCGALGALTEWIRSGVAPRRLQKFLFWAAAAIAGLPFVASELRQRIESVEAVDAALCTIIDILDDDIDGEYALVGVDRSDADVPAMLSLVADVMQRHTGQPEVQARGSHSVALLVQLFPSLQAASPPAMASTAAGVAAIAVVRAARRYPRRRDVIRSSSLALRALCSLAPLHAAVAQFSESGAFGALAASLKEEGVADVAAEALDTHGSALQEEEMLENAAAALALAGGIELVIARLEEAPQGSPLREAALKAIFEVARQDLRILTACDAGLRHRVGEFCAQVATEPPELGCRAREVAVLLAGLCH